MPDAAVDLFSEEWCQHAIDLWKAKVSAHIVDRDDFTFVVEWGETDNGTCSQTFCERGEPARWIPGQTATGDEPSFVLYASMANWEKIATGKLDPIAAVTSKRLHLRKGPIAVVIREADPFKRLLAGLGDIPTNWPA